MTEEIKDTAVSEEAVGETIEIIGISFRTAGKIYYFTPGSFKFNKGDRVIVETSRGVEIGTVKIENKLVSISEVVQPIKEVTRPATSEDILQDERNKQAEMDAAVICKKKIKNHNLDMSLVGAEYTFDNSKLIFYFTCETRVDFRELVKDLASTFRTRIELRQIGIRDEAKLMGGLGVCGRKFCCADFLTDFVQVSIKMAKEQNFSLNSAKVSGACGRLMCCLRYEHDVYEEAIKKTPLVGATVKTSDGVGTVVETKPLLSEIKVKFGDGDKDVIKLVKCADAKVLKMPGKSETNDAKEDEPEE